MKYFKTFYRWLFGGVVYGDISDKPYVITIENNTGLPVNNVVLLDGAERVYNFGSQGVRITYGISGVNYTGFLKSINAGRTFKCGGILLVADNRDESSLRRQLRSRFRIEEKYFNGASISKHYAPRYRSDQVITDQVYVKCEFFVDLLTKITFDTIMPMTVLTVSLFPRKQISYIGAFKKLRYKLRGLFRKKQNKYV